MDLDKFTKELTALQKQSGNYSANTAVKGKQTQLKITERLNEIDALLEVSSPLLLDAAIREKPITELTALISEREALNTIQKDYDFSGIAYAGVKPITAKIDALNAERKAYFIENIDDDNAEEFIKTFSHRQRPELEQMLLKYRAKIAKDAELKALVEPFMKDLNKMLKQPHINRTDRGNMQKRARMISPECQAAAQKLHNLPLLA